MKKSMKAVACLFVMAGLLAGCSSKNDMDKTESSVNNSTQNAVDKTKKAAKDTKDSVDDNIDNVMNYFKENGIKYENMQNIEDMDFAAYEGRSFMMNGNNVYLYRIKNKDENMQKVIQEAKDKGMVKVRINNKEQEYAAQVNGTYLMLYDTKADHSDLQKMFLKYQSGGVGSKDSTMDKQSVSTSDDSITEDNTKENTTKVAQ